MKARRRRRYDPPSHARLRKLVLVLRTISKTFHGHGFGREALQPLVQLIPLDKHRLDLTLNLAHPALNGVDGAPPSRRHMQRPSRTFDYSDRTSRGLLAPGHHLHGRFARSASIVSLAQYLSDTLSRPSFVTTVFFCSLASFLNNLIAFLACSPALYRHCASLSPVRHKRFRLRTTSLAR